MRPLEQLTILLHLHMLHMRRSLWITLYHQLGWGMGQLPMNISVVPQKEPYFLPPVRSTGHWEVEVGMNSTSDVVQPNSVMV
jgi:hypothetical protein